MPQRARSIPSIPLTASVAALAVTLALPGSAAAGSTTGPTASMDVSVAAPNEINLAAPGLVPVTIHGSATLDVADLDLASLRVSAGAGRGVGVAREADGTPVTRVADTDDDGTADLIAFVDKDELAATGGLDATTDELTVVGATVGGEAVTGADTTSPTVTLEIKFSEDAEIRRQGDTVVSTTEVEIDEPLAVLAAEGDADMVPLFDPVTVARLDAAEPVVAAAELDSSLPDLGSWYHVTLPADADVDAVLAALEDLDEIEYAYPSPEPVPPPQIQTDTPDFTGRQGYFGPAPTGIDADFSRQDPRLRGEGITIVNLEYDWEDQHEDLLLGDADVGGGAFLRYTGFGPDHGTAVFGVLVGIDNHYGVTGGVPDADMFGISPTRAPNYSWQPGPALAYLAGRGILGPGDVVLLEQQTSSPLGGTRYAPLEWVASVYEANVVLASQGVNVVSTGGNGNTSTDDPMYTRNGELWFDRSIRDSGAIYVGAGSSTTRERLSFSNYGSRFDLQAWGQNITTAGYCTLYCIPDNPYVRYSSTFSGTSGAGPIVTTAVVAVQSYLKATGQQPMTAPEVAELLIETGTPQGPQSAPTHHIGPLPNLRAALISIEVDAPTTEATVTGVNSTGNPPARRIALPVVTLEADDGWGSGVVRTEYRIDGGPWRTYTGPIRVDGNGWRTVQYRSIDANGNVEDFQQVAFHAVGRHPVRP